MCLCVYVGVHTCVWTEKPEEDIWQPAPSHHLTHWDKISHWFWLKLMSTSPTDTPVSTPTKALGLWALVIMPGFSQRCSFSRTANTAASFLTPLLSFWHLPCSAIPWSTQPRVPHLSFLSIFWGLHPEKLLGLPCADDSEPTSPNKLIRINVTFCWPFTYPPHSLDGVASPHLCMSRRMNHHHHIEILRSSFPFLKAARRCLAK